MWISDMPVTKALVIVFLTGVLMNTAECAAKGHSKVIVVGAGMSGLMAAKTLHEGGVTDYVILEGENRIGGRTKDIKLGTETLEIGSMYIHNPTGNPINTLAQKHGVAFKAPYDGNWKGWDANGNPLTDVQISGSYRKLAEAVNAIDDLALKLYKENKPDVSVRAAFSQNGWNPQTPLERAMEWAGDTGDYAGPADGRSTKYNHDWAEKAFGEGDLICSDSRGYATIHKGLVQSFMGSNQTRIKLGQSVRSISQTASRVTVTTASGDVYTADYVIVSASLGVLKSGLIGHTPSLPQWKRDAINKFRMNAYVSTYWQFPSRFWDAETDIVYVDQVKGRYPAWVDMKYYHPAHNTLRVAVVDDEARRISGLTHTQVKDEVMAVLRKMYGNNIPQPSNWIIADWVTNKHFKGSYSSWPVGFSDVDQAALCNPAGRVHFTGEHCSTRFLQSVHGAYYAGVCQGQKLLTCVKGGKCTEVNTPAPTTPLRCDLESKVSTSGGVTSLLSASLVLSGILLHITCLL